MGRSTHQRVPPANALQQAQAVQACAFDGLYVDANAIAPATALAIARLMGAAYATAALLDRRLAARNNPNVSIG